METTIFLSQLFGLFALIVGLAFLFGWKKFRKMVDDMVESSGLFYFMILLELIGGLAIILSHNLWGTFLEGLISVIGWVMAIEATVYLFMPKKLMDRFIRFFNKKWCFIIGSIIYLVLGIYLVYQGFFV